MNRIEGFFGDYRFLSNFYGSQITYEGLSYPSVEHAYQAAKTLDPKKRDTISIALTAGVAKKMGQMIVLRPDWEDIKVQVMKDLLVLKFEIPRFRERLLATEDAYLEETNYWGDNFWGVCNGKGQNILGRLLMEVREEIRGNVAERPIAPVSKAGDP